MVDLWPNYVSMVNGLSRATRARARAAAQTLLAQAGLEDVAADASERVTKLADEIVAASRANRELLENLVTSEVDRAATRLGFVRADDLSEIRAEIAALRAQLTVVMAPNTDPVASAPAKKAPAKKAPAKKAPAKKAAASDAPAKKAAAKKSPARRSPAKKAVAGKSPAKKAPAKKAATSAKPGPDA